MVAFAVALALAHLVAPAAAHLAMFHPAMYGFNCSNPWSYLQITPLRDLEYKDWWFHGYASMPPAPHEMLEIPSGGVLHAEIACNKAQTSYGPRDFEKLDLVCKPSEGNNQIAHSTDDYRIRDTSQLKDVRGHAIAIAYKEEAWQAKPSDFVVISTNQSGPWFRNTEFPIPKGLPPCPPMGCLCLWGWVHSPFGGQGENYFIGFRCNVTNADAGGKPLATPQVARKCPYDKSNCTIGAKAPHYWFQKDNNNNHQGEFDPPFYNWEYGFADGAQTDIWEQDPGNHTATVWAPAPYATKSDANPATLTMALPNKTPGRTRCLK